MRQDSNLLFEALATVLPVHHSPVKVRFKVNRKPYNFSFYWKNVWRTHFAATTPIVNGQKTPNIIDAKAQIPDSKS